MDSNGAAIIDSAIEQPDPSTFWCKSGVVLRLKSVSRVLVVDIGKKFKLPKPPKVFIPEKGREEENPNDPDYIASLRTAQYEQGMTVVGAYMAFGTTPEFIPEGMEPPESDVWRDDIQELTGLVIPPTGRSRYVYWLKYYAMNDEELNNLIVAIMRLSGEVPESDVQDIEDSFRNQTSGNTSTQVSHSKET